MPEKLYDQSHGVNGGSSPSVVALSLAELFTLCVGLSVFLRIIRRSQLGSN